MEITINRYETFKKELDTELSRTAESFVKIGYLLKIARDNPSILEGSGYANINEMAAAEYNIDKSIVSRWISINDEFSEGGYSDKLKSEFKGYGYSKLAIMLSIPEEIRAEISPNFSKSEIQAIKDEVDEEKKISPMEVYLEGQTEEQSMIEGNLNKALHQLLLENPEMYISLYHANDIKAVNEILAPAGESIYTVRIQGVGRYMISFKGIETDIALMNVRNPEEKEKYTWQQLFEALNRLINHELPEKTSWESVYCSKFPEIQKPEPEKPKVAPVQQNKKDDKKPVPKKISKVTKAKTVKKPEKPKADELSKADDKKPLEGQKTIENYPEVLPQDKNETDLGVNETDSDGNDTLPAAVETAETGINTKAYRISEAQKKAYLEDIEFRTQELLRYTKDECYSAAIVQTQKIQDILEKLNNNAIAEESED